MSRDEKEEEEPVVVEPLADAAGLLIERQDVLRQQWRQLELADQAERQKSSQQEEQETPHIAEDDSIEKDEIDILDNGKTVLRYCSYLAHQRYHDDLKHVDCHYIDYGSIIGGSESNTDSHCHANTLVIEQDKRLGKGGLCWDAAFILGEHLISHSDEWRNQCIQTDADAAGPSSPTNKTLVVELGSGTGLAGLMIAKAVPNCHVRITDLPELLPLMTRNVNRNFESDHIIVETTNDESDHESNDNNNETAAAGSTSSHINLQQATFDSMTSKPASLTNAKNSRGFVSANVLQWGVMDGYKRPARRQERQYYDVVLGADVVASLYDPIALAETIHALCHANSIVFVSYEERLTGPHEQFEERLHSLFCTVERIRPTSRNRNPQVWILKARDRIVVS